MVKMSTLPVKIVELFNPHYTDSWVWHDSHVPYKVSNEPMLDSYEFELKFLLMVVKVH